MSKNVLATTITATTYTIIIRTQMNGRQECAAVCREQEKKGSGVEVECPIRLRFKKSTSSDLFEAREKKLPRKSSNRIGSEIGRPT